MQTFCQTGSGCMGLKSNSIDILPVIVLSCYCIGVSPRRKLEHLNNPFNEWGEMMNTNHHAEKKSFLLDEVSRCVVGVCWCPLSWREKSSSQTGWGLHVDIHSVVAFCFTYSLGYLKKKIIEAQLCYCCQRLCSSLIVVIIEQRGLRQSESTGAPC